MAKRKSRSRKSKKHELFFILGVVLVLAVILLVITNMNGWGQKAIVGKAFSFTGCEELPCYVNNANEDHDYAFSYKDVLYKLTLTDVDTLNKKVKYQVTQVEDVDEDAEADLIIDHMDVESIEPPYANFKIIIKNVGDKDVYDKFKVRLDTLDEDDEYWKTTYKYVEGIDQDEEVIVMLSIKYNQNYYADTGKIPYVVYVDPSNVVDESTVANNVEDDVYAD